MTHVMAMSAKLSGCEACCKCVHLCHDIQCCYPISASALRRALMASMVWPSQLARPAPARPAWRSRPSATPTTLGTPAGRGHASLWRAALPWPARASHAYACSAAHPVLSRQAQCLHRHWDERAEVSRPAKTWRSHTLADKQLQRAAEAEAGGQQLHSAIYSPTGDDHTTVGVRQWTFHWSSFLGSGSAVRVQLQQAVISSSASPSGYIARIGQV